MSETTNDVLNAMRSASVQCAGFANRIARTLDASRPAGEFVMVPRDRLTHEVESMMVEFKRMWPSDTSAEKRKRGNKLCERFLRLRDHLRGWSGDKQVPEWSATPSVEPVCGTCNGRGEVGGPCGQTPDNFEFRTEPCPECCPNGRDMSFLDPPPANTSGATVETLTDLYWHITKHAIAAGGKFAACMGALPALELALSHPSPGGDGVGEAVAWLYEASNGCDPETWATFAKVERPQPHRHVRNIRPLTYAAQHRAVASPGVMKNCHESPRGTGFCVNCATGDREHCIYIEPPLPSGVAGLAGCPFCGKDDLRICVTVAGDHQVMCECGARGPDNSEAISAWNRRAGGAGEDAVERAARALFDFDTQEDGCGDFSGLPVEFADHYRKQAQAALNTASLAGAGGDARDAALGLLSSLIELQNVSSADASELGFLVHSEAGRAIGHFCKLFDAAEIMRDAAMRGEGEK